MSSHPSPSTKKPKLESDGISDGNVPSSPVSYIYRDFSGLDYHPKSEEEVKASDFFTFRLHNALSNPALQHILRWQSHGRSWTVVDEDRLLTANLTKSSESAKNGDTFNRVMKNYGFREKKCAGPDQGSYYHECFLKDRTDLLVLMEDGQEVLKGKRIREPDFVTIHKFLPLPAKSPAEKTKANQHPAGHKSSSKPSERLSAPVAQAPVQYGYFPAPGYPAAVPSHQPDKLDAPPQQMHYWPQVQYPMQHLSQPYGNSQVVPPQAGMPHPYGYPQAYGLPQQAPDGMPPRSEMRGQSPVAGLHVERLLAQSSTNGEIAYHKATEAPIVSQGIPSFSRKAPVDGVVNEVDV